VEYTSHIIYLGLGVQRAEVEGLMFRFLGLSHEPLDVMGMYFRLIGVMGFP
jgi:hypothetical protein